MKTLSIILIGITILAMSCKDPFNYRIKGNGNVVTEERSVSSFDEIKSAGSFNVYVNQDTVASITVKAEQNLLQYIETNIIGNKLIIKTADNKNIKNTKPINVYVSSDLIAHVALSGSGYMNVMNVNASYLKLDISGSGDIDYNGITNELNTHISGSGKLDLSGSTNSSYLDITGSGAVRSYNLVQNDCEVDISGSGSSYVNVDNTLDVRISGSGDVHYIGYPTVSTNVTGSGSVVNNN